MGTNDSHAPHVHGLRRGASAANAGDFEHRATIATAAAEPRRFAGASSADATNLRGLALAAIMEAADALGVDPAELSMLAYRRICSEPEHSQFPQALAISTLFGGWQRARELVACRCLATLEDAGARHEQRALEAR